ncbi:Amino acid transporter transmembrane [Penicillium argentinense]|uniref:Amino acid transporter transmembrane n=1 Tax=Penicillium argentinense TaxID=1131581 RepID=A0A9W9EID7_9EURO|nr:Amino acid transporter transmembrane [Penicillium argentinense]KAJ5082324.1 Amino acid transporter transmembrane [Penicillium argentinense]
MVLDSSRFLDQYGQKDDESLDRDGYHKETPAQFTNVQAGDLKGSSAYDAVFGELTQDGPKYRSVIHLTLSLVLSGKRGLDNCMSGWVAGHHCLDAQDPDRPGLSITSVFHTLMVVPGSILLCVVTEIAIWTSYVVGIFNLKHQEVYGIDDAAGLMFGRPGRELYEAIFWLYWIFNGGSGILGISIGLNAVSDHAACIAVFVVVSAIIGFSFGSIRTLARMTWLVACGFTTTGNRLTELDMGYLACWNVLLIVVGMLLTVGGTYGSIISIINSLKAGGATGPLACADNSSS